MTKAEILKKEILRQYRSVRQFALEMSIPYSTLVTALERGIEGMAYGTVIKMCDKLNLNPVDFSSLERDTSLGAQLLETYEGERPLSRDSRADLYYRLAYPEKFWKIVNFYYNSGKAWIPGKNQEKLERVIQQEKDKQHFLNEVFRRVRP